MSKVLAAKEHGKAEEIIEILEKRGRISPKEAEFVCNKLSATIGRHLKALVET